MSDSSTTSPFLPLPDGIVISSVRTAPTELVVHIACRLPWATCPLCQQPSERVHGSYGRRVADLPCGGRRVILALTARKFVCNAPTCPRQIFTERLPDLVQSYARMTNRLRDALVALGLATSAEVSERLAPSLGMLVSFLQSLRPRYKLATLSNDWPGAREQQNRLFQLEERLGVDVMLYSCEEGLQKPDAEFYLLACERLGVHPKEVVFIDDREQCVEGAQQVGMKAILFNDTDQVIAEVPRIAQRAVTSSQPA